MSNVALFTVGFLVTLIVALAMALLIWGAVMDGREEDRHRDERLRADAAVPDPQPAGAAVVSIDAAGAEAGTHRRDAGRPLTRPAA